MKYVSASFEQLLSKFTFISALLIKVSPAARVLSDLGGLITAFEYPLDFDFKVL